MPISWTAIQALHEPDLERHWARCRDELTLDCPLAVFEELFFEHHGDDDFGGPFRAIELATALLAETGLHSGGVHTLCGPPRLPSPGVRGARVGVPPGAAGVAL